jgi:hypothetical protein
MRHGYPQVRRMCCGHPGRRGPGRKRSPPGFDNPHEAYASSITPKGVAQGYGDRRRA